MTTAVQNMTIVDELTHLHETHGGKVSPRDVIEFARDPETALHSRFDWDDTTAAEKWRVAQARRVLRVYVTVTIPDRSDPVRVRAFVALPSDRGEEGGYRPIVSVLNDDDQRAELLAMAKSELEAFRRKYATLDELASVHLAIDNILEITQ